MLEPETKKAIVKFEKEVVVRRGNLVSYDKDLKWLKYLAGKFPYTINLSVDEFGLWLSIRGFKDFSELMDVLEEIENKYPIRYTKDHPDVGFRFYSAGPISINAYPGEGAVCRPVVVGQQDILEYRCM